MRNPSRARFASWVVTGDLDKTIITIAPFVFILFGTKFVLRYPVIILADGVLLFAAVKIESKVGQMINKMRTYSAYFFETPYLLIPLGTVALVLCAGGFVLTIIDLTNEQSFVITYLQTLLLSLSILLLATATKCIIVGTKILSFKFIRRGFFGAFQRIFVLARSVIVTFRWICYFCNNWPIPRIGFIISQPKTTSCYAYIVMKCVFLLWHLWDLAFTINSYRENKKVALKPAPKEQIKDNCIVCLNEPKDPVILECGHIFCYKCIYRWISKNPTCPLCRQPIQENKKIEYFDGNFPLVTYFTVF